MLTWRALSFYWIVRTAAFVIWPLATRCVLAFFNFLSVFGTQLGHIRFGFLFGFDSEPAHAVPGDFTPFMMLLIAKVRHLD